MPTCRDISPELWEHARRALVFYFSRRHRATYAEDLAQETLTVLWTRDDYVFEKEEDFLRVCYGFASRVLQHDFRQQQRNRTEPLTCVDAVARPQGAMLKPVESNVLLEEVLRIGSATLRESDWNLICDAISDDPSRMPGVENAGIANKIRVRLSRARSRLATATGWKQKKRSNGS
jgi:DNA-directed RNA polymerase specialized sigma24 family protein